MNKIVTCILFFLTAINNSLAQLCTGTLGNPVVNITFGGGPNPGPQLAQVPSSYQYTNLDCPSEGFYTLRNSSSTCPGDLWHDVSFDHTANDPTGYFLLINAREGTSDIYSETIRGLCPNTKFELSIWILNLLKPTSCLGGGSDPNITIGVSDLAGTALATYNTGKISETPRAAWIQYRFQFLSPSSGDVVINISNTGSGCGNDFAIDDITFRPCGGTMNAAFIGYPGSQIQTCTQQNYTLTATYNGFSGPTIQWQVSYDGFSWSDIPGATANTYVRTPTGLGGYSYRFSVTENNSNCRYYSNTITVEVQKQPFIKVTNYVYGCYGSDVPLQASGGIFYEWTGPNGFNSSLQAPVVPRVGFKDTGMYIVKGSTNDGCFAYDTTNLVVYPAPVASVNSTQLFLCEDDSVQLVAGGSARYEWTPSSGLSNDTIANPFAKPRETTTYTVKVFNDPTCYDNATVNVVVWKKPIANAGPDKFTSKKKPVVLEGSPSGTNISYSWSPPNYLDNPLAARPKASPPGATMYTLTVTSNNGCGNDTDEVKVEILDKVYIPSAFTPNNDGLNDLWQVFTIEDYPNSTVQVFNRWGQRVYFSKGLDYKPWDGTFNGLPVSPGTYVYVVNLQNNTKVLKGTVTVIR